MGKKKYRPEYAWLLWSYSKLSAAIACPFRCFYESIIREPAPQYPQAAFGKAVHYIFKKFFTRHPSTKRFPFEKPDVLQRAWKGFWWSAVAGKHGFDGWGTKAEEISWLYPEQPAGLFVQGYRVMDLLHRNFGELRHDGQPRWVERRFKFTRHGLTLVGIIDRVDFEKEGVIITENKKGLSRSEMEKGLQFTIYQLAWEICSAKWLGECIPLKGFSVYRYTAGKTEPAPLRSPEEMSKLFLTLHEASAYFHGVLNGYPPHPELVPEFRLFNQNDIERGDVSPILPRSHHCNFCRHYQQCLAWETNSLPIAREVFRAKCNHQLSRLQPTQERLILEGLPPVVQWTNDYLIAIRSFSKAKQLSLEV
jgi:RecB family exonuclease